MRARYGVRRGFQRLSDRASVSSSPIIAQVFGTVDAQSFTVPGDATWAFYELLAAGGFARSSISSYRVAGGGAGADTVAAVTAGVAVQFTLPEPELNSTTARITHNGQSVLSLTSPAASTSSAAPGGAGKYPGQSGGNGNGGFGRGGGRLAGAISTTDFASSPVSPGHGAGGRWVGDGTSTFGAYGGRAIGCVTFFRSQDEAIAFANALYGGAWQP